MPRRAETVLTVIVLIALPTVMYGGYSLLGLQTAGNLTEFQTTYFRAGHAHAGVLLVMTLAALNVAGRFGLPERPDLAVRDHAARGDARPVRRHVPAHGARRAR